MIAGRDSSFDRPSAAVLAQARAAGVRVWGGYVGVRSRSELGLAVLWSEADFNAIRGAGMTPIGFCSGWDDPLVVRNRAAAWGVLLCLDVEAGIRDDGAWVQSWLNAAGAGLYGNRQVHAFRTAAFHVASWYGYAPPACYDPGATWPDFWPRPTGPLAWQYCGGHAEFGIDVDSAWYDDWFAPAVDPPARFSGGEGTVIAAAARPDGSGIDLFRVGTDGNVYWQGNTPPWVLGAWGQISSEGDTRAVSATWSDGDTLIVHRVARDGSIYQNAMHPSAGWQFGAWVANGAHCLVPALLTETGLVAHAHPFAASAPVSGTTGPPA